MKIQTSRFGQIEIQENNILNFPEGLLGFEQETRFTIVDPADNTFIMWLQSLQNPQIAFPIIEPDIFQINFQNKLLPADIKSVELEGATEAKAYVILTIPQDITLLTANMKAPIIVNIRKNMAKQIVLQDNKLSVKKEIYKELKLAITTSASSNDSKRTSVSEPATGAKATKTGATTPATANEASSNQN